jgi:hypothetical protein
VNATEISLEATSLLTNLLVGVIKMTTAVTEPAPMGVVLNTAMQAQAAEEALRQYIAKLEARTAIGYLTASGSLRKGCPPIGEPEGWKPVYE